ncbi:MAG: hypothetical protein KAV87_67875 [Desulfobacteraceae bacterium]|nr:hypothetical protein [Desulfobacteraceae bacterium]
MASAYEKVGATIPGLVAAADLSGDQFKFVKMTATGVALCGLGEAAIGILQNKPTIGQACTIFGIGSTSKVVASAALAIGVSVTPNAAALAVGALTTNYIAGVLLTATGASGDLGTVYLHQPGRLA